MNIIDIQKDNNNMYVAKRICPECGNKITHRCARKSKLKLALESNRPCVECTNGKKKPYDTHLYKEINPIFLDNKWHDTRNCPNCGDIIHYSSDKKYILIRSLKNANRERRPCAHCANSGENNGFHGKLHSQKTKEQVSNSRKGKAMGVKNAMNSLENRRRVSESLKQKYQSGELDFLKKIQSETAKQSHAQGKIKTFPVSGPEKKLKKILKSIFLQVTPQFNIGSLKYDFYIKDKNLLIEFNGDYWHCNPTKYLPDYFHTIKGMTAKELWKKDNQKTKIAKDNGYKIITIWEDDFNKQREKEIQKITQA